MSLKIMNYSGLLKNASLKNLLTRISLKLVDLTYLIKNKWTISLCRNEKILQKKLNKMQVIW